MAQPLGLDRIVGLLQRIACPLLQPTADVIESRLQELARRGLLSIAAAGTGPAVARRTAAGLRHLRQLLCTPPPPRGAAHHDLVFMLKVCLLDLLDDADCAAVIDELRQDLLRPSPPPSTRPAIAAHPAPSPATGSTARSPACAMI